MVSSDGVPAVTDCLTRYHSPPEHTSPSSSDKMNLSEMRKSLAREWYIFPDPP